MGGTLSWLLAGGSSGDRGSRRLLVPLLAVALGLLALLAAGCGGGGSEGERLFRENCSACHGDRGARIPDVPLNDPGFLSRLGSSGLDQVVAQGKGIMPAWGKDREGPLDDQQIKAIVDYLLSPDGLSAAGGAGRSLFVKNCATCHGARGSRIPAAPLNSTTFVQGLQEDDIRAAIEKGKGTMPAFGKNYDGPLSDQQINDVIRYVAALSGGSIGGSARLASASGAAATGGGDAGQQTFVSTCSGCHGSAGNAIPAADLTSPDFLSARSDDQLMKAISAGTGAMPPQGKSAGGHLSDDEIRAVVAYLKQAAGTGGGGSGSAPPGVLNTPPAGAQELFQNTCSGCHSSMPGAGVDPTQIHDIIANGLADKGMPAFGSRLSDDQISGLASLLASGQGSGGGDQGASSAGGSGNPFAGLVRHVDGWITKHPNIVREQGSQLCQKCHQVSFCSSCHTAR